MISATHRAESLSLGESYDQFNKSQQFNEFLCTGTSDGGRGLPQSVQERVSAEH